MKNSSLENYESPFVDQFEGENTYKSASKHSEYEPQNLENEQYEFFLSDLEDLSNNFLADANQDEAEHDEEIFVSEIPNLYPYEQGLSPFALQAKRQWQRGGNDLRPEAWRGKIFGLVVHTTGGSIVGKAIGNATYPTIAGIDHYFHSYGCHYINGWRGVKGGDLVQVANENKLAYGVGMREQAASVKANRFEKDLPAILVQKWKERWPTYNNPLDLPPVLNVNTCYVHVECLPVVYYLNNKTVIDRNHPPMRAGLRFTKDQHDSIAILAYDIAIRNHWPMDIKWWKTPRLLGHEDLGPITRHDKSGGWDPGALRIQPYFDWEYVYHQIENIHAKGFEAFLNSTIQIAPELNTAIKSHSKLFYGALTNSSSPDSRLSIAVETSKWTNAIKSNRYYGDKLGWNKYTYQINDFLLRFVGLQNVSLSEEKFAEAIHKWQKSQGLPEGECDGIIGPNSWRIMSSQISGIHTQSVTAANSRTSSSPNWVAELSPILEKYRGDIPLYFLLGWISIESDGRIGVVTSLDERGYFQIHPSESKALGITDHRRLSSDKEFSIQSGIQLVNHLRKKTDRIAVSLGFPKNSLLYWHVVKLSHWLPTGVNAIVSEMKSQSFKPATWADFKTFVIDNKEKIKERIRALAGGKTWDPQQGINNVEKLFNRANQLVPDKMNDEIFMELEDEAFTYPNYETEYETDKMIDESELNETD